MHDRFENLLTNKIADFLVSIGIDVVPSSLEENLCFLPGIRVDRGKLLVDESKLAYPGDLLHEAGHLAVAPGDLRTKLTGEVVVPGVNMDDVEVQATAWAYAAIVHLDIDPVVLFHAGGYDSKSAGLLFTYAAGVYPGAFGLSQLGMTAVGPGAVQSGVPPYPYMLRWTRE